jgi:cytochrome c-type biogenesis protein CcmF
LLKQSLAANLRYILKSLKTKNMYSNLAQLGVVLSILLGALVPLGLIWIKPLGESKFRKLLDNVILIQFILITFAFISLIYAYVNSDFSLYNVFRNSHQAIPLIYKFSGVWSNHEGSMILWIFLLSLVNFISTQHKLSDKNKIWISSIQIIITSSLLAYTILKSNPFVKITPIPEQGAGFNPLLQDIGLAIHPPILYIGYVTTIIAFTIVIAALIQKKLSSPMLEIMQKWTLISWCFLTLGVTLGGWWAYRELGWGGYWFWDPVENASILPWLTSTALIHSIYASRKLDTNYKWTILLSIFTFLLTVLTTFLVRSGIVTSVHSFANDTNRGVFILGLLFCYSVFSLGLFAIYGQHFNSYKNHNWLSRFGGINLANIFWVIATCVIVLSLIYPLLIEVYTGEKISIDRSFFEKSFIPLLIPIILLLALTLPSSWQKILPIHYLHFTYSLGPAALISVCFYYYSINTPSIISTIAFFSGALVVTRMGFWFYQRLASPITLKFYLIWGIHLATGLLAMNISFIETNSLEKLINMKESEQTQFVNFDIHYNKKENIAVNNYLAGRVVLDVEKHSKKIITLKPEIRYYPVEKTQTSEASIYHTFFYDLYAVISEVTKDADVIIKLYFKPIISWMWMIFGVLFICGMSLLSTQKSKKNAPN